ncbi:MAG: hypothetical protein ACXVEF_02500 [Polyangiales bacterium]
MRRLTAFLSACAVFGAAGASSALDAGKIDGSPVRLDVTETAVLNWHGNNRNDPAGSGFAHRADDNYGEWINRLNVLMAWRAWQFGLRLDTVVYANAPTRDEFEHDPAYSQADRTAAKQSLPYRYRDTFLVQGNLRKGPRDPAIWPSKVFLSYVNPNLEVTVGDAYVAFGRGLVLNVRKFDEIGADTTVQGGKIIYRLSPLTFTGVAGLSNPTRVDDATGYKLQDPDDLCTDGQPADETTYNYVSQCKRSIYPYRQTWSRDAIFGGRVEGRIGASTIGVHVADIHRRVNLFPGTDPTSAEPSLARDVLGYGTSVAIPRISDKLPLNVYGEVAIQKRVPFPDDSANPKPRDDKYGYAGYMALSLPTGAVTSSFEFKHYRSYLPAKLNMDPTIYGSSGFTAVQYTANPTVELITQDSLFDNSCNTGGRLREDVHVADGYTVFGSAAYFENWQIQCGAGPTLGLTEKSDQPLDEHHIYDGYVGFDLRSQTEQTYLTVMLGSRKETRKVGDDYYREGWLQLNGSKALGGLWSIEVDAWHRNRYQNLEAWREGQTYLGLKYASKRSIVIGHEYTTRKSQIVPGARSWDGAFLDGLSGLATSSVQHYINFGGQLKFSDEVMLRFMVGQQRGALKCVNGVCRFFPPFEGVRTELIVRY